MVNYIYGYLFALAHKVCHAKFVLIIHKVRFSIKSLIIIKYLSLFAKQVKKQTSNVSFYKLLDAVISMINS